MTTAPPLTTEKEPAQNRLPGMEATPLEKATEIFIENKIKIAELKKERDELSNKILIEMKKEDKQSLVISHAGDNFLFEILIGEDRLACKKETRSPVAKEEKTDDQK